jgi:hypothetical protein
VYKRILALGFNKNKIVEYKDYYLVEGDMVFKKNAKVKTSSPNLKQAFWYASSISYPATINVYLDRSSFTQIDSTTITRAVGMAVGAWQGTNAIIHFAVVDTYAACKVCITNGSLSENACGGWAEFPWEGFNGSTVYLDEDFIVENGSDLCLLIAHQIGHVIGLRHTDWYEQGESQASPIADTPQYPYTDPYPSFMNAVTCGKSWSGFTPDDIIAILHTLG